MLATACALCIGKNDTPLFSRAREAPRRAAHTRRRHRAIASAALFRRADLRSSWSGSGSKNQFDLLAHFRDERSLLLPPLRRG
jgi:hypothetical protein